MKKILTSAVAAVATATAAFADGHAWSPEGPIRLLIAFAAGGGTDTMGRGIAAEMGERYGWEVIPENVTGAGGLNTAKVIAEAAADELVIGMIVTETMGYNNVSAGSPISADDVTALTTAAPFQMGIIAKSDRGWTDFSDVIAAAQAGEQISFGTMSQRLSDLAFLLGEANGVEFNIVQGRGGRASLNGVNAGDLDVGFAAGVQAKGVMAGELVNLASMIGEPLKMSPDAPLVSDYGLEFDAAGLFAFVGPSGMPADAADAFTNAVIEIITDESTGANAFINRAFGGTAIITGAELDAMFRADAAAAGALLAAVDG